MARPDDPATVYLDSNALIRAVTRGEGYEVIEELLRQGTTGKLTIMTSALCFVEVRGTGRADPYDADLDARILAALDGFLYVDFGRALAMRARRYAFTYGLKNPDAIHLASAVVGQADVLMTWDTGFPLDQEVDGVWVDEPYTPGPPTLPGT